MRHPPDVYYLSGVLQPKNTQYLLLYSDLTSSADNTFPVSQWPNVIFVCLTAGVILFWTCTKFPLHKGEYRSLRLTYRYPKRSDQYMRILQ